MTHDRNPFPKDDLDRHALWDMLVRRDIEAFTAGDWSMVANDFVADGFFGLDASRSGNPDSWRLGYPDLESYQRTWLAQSQEFMGARLAEDPGEALYRATVLRHIEVQGATAIAHKRFAGRVALLDGDGIELHWQTLYYCRKLGDLWKIAGFLGYLPNPMGS